MEGGIEEFTGIVWVLLEVEHVQRSWTFGLSRTVVILEALVSVHLNGTENLLRTVSLGEAHCVGVVESGFNSPPSALRWHN